MSFECSSPCRTKFHAVRTLNVHGDALEGVRQPHFGTSRFRFLRIWDLLSSGFWHTLVHAASYLTNVHAAVASQRFDGLTQQLPRNLRMNGARGSAWFDEVLKGVRCESASSRVWVGFGPHRLLEHRHRHHY